MTQIQEMLQTHPNQSAGIPADTLASTVESLSRCVAICTSCADACLGEPGVAELTRCIRTDLDCADICRATTSVLARQTSTDTRVVRAQLQACITACKSCAEECRQHADHHDHCRICAESCDECASACEKALNSIPA
jgi:hypothetical protein